MFVQTVTKNTIRSENRIFENLFRIKSDNFFSYQLRQRLKLPNKLYLMFIGGPEVEIQIINKVIEKSLGPVFPIAMHTQGCHNNNY